MGEAKHSPGPWTTEDEACVVGADGKAVFLICRDDEYWGVPDDGLPEAERERIRANLNLLKAAPLMLKTLRGLVRLCDKPADAFKDLADVEAQCKAAWDEARAAVDAAAGGGA